MQTKHNPPKFKKRRNKVTAFSLQDLSKVVNSRTFGSSWDQDKFRVRNHNTLVNALATGPFLAYFKCLYFILKNLNLYSDLIGEQKTSKRVKQNIHIHLGFIIELWFYESIIPHVSIRGHLLQQKISTRRKQLS